VNDSSVIEKDVNKMETEKIWKPLETGKTKTSCMTAASEAT
jgi:hypothetical protein